MLALALYREGTNETSAVYKYLSFFKVLEVRARGGDAIVALAATHLSRARQSAIPYIDPNQRPSGTDEEVALALYTEGRCAIAHAHSEPLIDPDDPADTRPIWSLVPLVQALAEQVIENEFGVPRWWPPDWQPEWSRVEDPDT